MAVQCYDRLAFPRGVPKLHTDAAGPAPPDAFGPFRVVHQIGAGALGPVFRTYQPELDRLVAVKMFRLDVQPERLQLLVGELQKLIAADLTHPGIAAPLAAGVAGPAAYLAQDFVEADSLDIVIREHGPAPTADAVRVAAQLAGALDFSAAVNIVHGALHPRDVLVSPDDTRLTGLGITRALDLLGVPSPVRRPYTAPERAAGRAWDRRADIFSLAAVVFELLWGRRLAGTGKQAADSITEAAGGDAGVLRAVFARALAENPADRFDTALAFANALKQGLSNKRSMVANQQAIVANQPIDARQQSIAPSQPLIVAGHPPIAPSHQSTVVSDRSSVPEPLVDSQVVDSQVVDSHVVDSHVVDSHAVESHVVGSHVVESHAVDRHTVESQDLPINRPDGTDVLQRTSGDDRFTIEPLRPVNPLQLNAEPAIRDDILAPPGAFGLPPDPELPIVAAEVPDIVDLDLRAAEAARYAKVESTPKVAAPVFDSQERQPPSVTPLPPPRAAGLPDSAHRRSRSAVWPFVLALVMGVAIGAVAMVVLLNRDREPAVASLPTAGTQPPRTETNSANVREFTEVAAATPPRADPEARSTPDATVAGPPSAEVGRVPPLKEVSRQPDQPVSRTTRDRVEPERAAPAAIGRILVRSTPAGARVFVDGRDAGVTPTTLRGLTRGSHTVRLVREGYVSAERTVSITAASPASSVIVEMSRPSVTPRRLPASAPSSPATATAGRYTGSLVIDSRPPGATVYIDGKQVGTTPLKLSAIEVGSHAVRLDHDGYNRWTSAVRIVAGEEMKVTASLER